MASGTTFWMEVEAHFRRAILYGNLQEKCRTQMLRSAFCGNLQEKMHMDMSQEPFCVEIYRENAAHYFQGPHFVWNLQETTRMDIAQEPFCVEIYRKNAARPPCPPRSNTGPFISCNRKNPSSVATLFGEKIVI